MNAKTSVTQLEIDQRIYDLYDEYCHGRIDRREFLARSAALVVGGLVMAQALQCSEPLTAIGGFWPRA